MNPTISSKAIIGKALTFSLALCLTGASLLTSTASAADFSASVNVAQDGDSLYSADQLDSLLAPIALYPDPLLAQIMVAATFDDQIQDAAQVISADGGADAIDQQSWDDSVKAVAHYPRVLFALSSQPDWTSGLGQAYATQSTDVMTSIQRLRAEAFTQGNLVTSSQQRVVAVAGMIQILPVQAGYVYLPSYDPAVAFSASAYISFGPAFAIDNQWDGQIDWHEHHIFDHHHHSVRTGDRDRIGRSRRAQNWARRRSGDRKGRLAHNRMPSSLKGGKGGNGGFGGNGGKGGKTVTGTKGGNGSKGSYSANGSKPGNSGKGGNTASAKNTASKPGPTTSSNKPGSTRGQVTRGQSNSTFNRAQSKQGQSNRAQTNRAQFNRGQSNPARSNHAQASRGSNQMNRGSVNTAMNRGGSMNRPAGRGRR